MKKTTLLFMALSLLSTSFVNDAAAAARKKTYKKKYTRKKVARRVPAKKVVAKKHTSSKSNAVAMTLDPKAHELMLRKLGGFYLGANVGYKHNGGEQSVHGTDVPTDGGSNLNRKGIAGISKSGIALDVNGGYLFRFKNYGIGAELYYDMLKSKSKMTLTLTDDITEDFNLEFKRNFGLAMKAGYFLNDQTFTYARLGMERQKISMKFFDSSSSTIALPAIDKSFNFNGFVFGVGAQHLLTQRIILQAEFKTSFFGEKTVSESYAYITSGGGTRTTNIKVHPKNTSFSIGAAYQF